MKNQVDGQTSMVSHFQPYGKVSKNRTTVFLLLWSRCLYSGHLKASSVIPEKTGVQNVVPGLRPLTLNWQLTPETWNLRPETLLINDGDCTKTCRTTALSMEGQGLLFKGHDRKHTPETIFRASSKNRLMLPRCLLLCGCVWQWCPGLPGQGFHSV